ncbi:hypothetical protein [Micromonospora sp. NPDC005299]|uniref:hypothetical protein n=1 Tax=Micromonospora sp. NPDC005299 TaxID=3364231 RepID=UPI0036B93099
MSAVLAERPVLTPVTEEDLALAVHVVRVYAPELWPQGQARPSESVPYPCGLARWAHAMIHAGGLTKEQFGEPA